MQAFNFDPATINRLWFAPGVLRPWEVFKPESGVAAGFLHPEKAHRALVWTPPIITGTALAIKRENQWDFEYGAYWKRPRRLSPEIIEVVLAALLQITELGRSFWSKSTGFEPKLGALGMFQPRYQLGLRFVDDSVLWLVFGSPGLYGEYSLLFKSTEQDKNSNPHPAGEPQKLANTELLWAILDAVTGQ